LKIKKLFAIIVLFLISLTNISYAQLYGRGPDDQRFEFKQESRFEDDFEERYSGIRKEDFIFERVFDFIGEIDPSEVMPFCDDPEKIADIILGKVKDNVGDFSNICNNIVEQETNCYEEAEFHCSGFTQQDIEDAIDELEELEILANSCPVNKDAILDLCILRSKEYMEQNLEFVEENCGFQWEDYGQFEQRNCELQLRDNICDKDEYIDDCIERFGVPEACPEFPPPDYEMPTCEFGRLEPRYDQFFCQIGYICVEIPIPEPEPTVSLLQSLGNCSQFNSWYSQSLSHWFTKSSNVSKTRLPVIPITPAVVGFDSFPVVTISHLTSTIHSFS